jgi:hypothetical protein
MTAILPPVKTQARMSSTGSRADVHKDDRTRELLGTQQLAFDAENIDRRSQTAPITTMDHIGVILRIVGSASNWQSEATVSTSDSVPLADSDACQAMS